MENEVQKQLDEVEESIFQHLQSIKDIIEEFLTNTVRSELILKRPAAQNNYVMDIFTDARSPLHAKNLKQGDVRRYFYQIKRSNKASKSLGAFNPGQTDRSSDNMYTQYHRFDEDLPKMPKMPKHRTSQIINAKIEEPGFYFGNNLPSPRTKTFQSDVTYSEFCLQYFQRNQLVLPTTASTEVTNANVESQKPVLKKDGKRVTVSINKKHQDSGAADNSNSAIDKKKRSRFDVDSPPLSDNKSPAGNDNVDDAEGLSSTQTDRYLPNKKIDYTGRKLERLKVKGFVVRAAK